MKIIKQDWVKDHRTAHLLSLAISWRTGTEKRCATGNLLPVHKYARIYMRQDAIGAKLSALANAQSRVLNKLNIS